MLYVYRVLALTLTCSMEVADKIVEKTLRWFLLFFRHGYANRAYNFVADSCYARWRLVGN